MLSFLATTPSSILLAFVTIMPAVAPALPVAVLAAVHKENQRKVADAVSALIAARAAAKASGEELARSVARETNARMRVVPAPPVPVPAHRRLPKVVAKKGGVNVLKAVKQVIAKGRPRGEGCAQCRRLAEGKKGGHGHTCGKVAYSRLAQ